MKVNQQEEKDDELILSDISNKNNEIDLSLEGTNTTINILTSMISIIF